MITQEDIDAMWDEDVEIYDSPEIKNTHWAVYSNEIQLGIWNVYADAKEFYDDNINSADFIIIVPIYSFT